MLMTCSCGSTRFLKLSGKQSDTGSATYVDGDEVIEHYGYAPDFKDICGGDYISFTFCAECGKIQSSIFPISKLEIEEAFGESS